SHKRQVRAPADPWDARTLEWSIPSPPPHYNFAEIPTVHALDEHWHRKYTEDDEGRPVRVDDASPSDGDDTAPEGNGAHDHEGHDGHDDDGHGIHMPSPSYFPLVAALGLPVMAYGMVYGRSSGQSYVVTVLGALILLTGLFAWAMEPSAEPDEHGPEGGQADAGTSAPEPALVAAGNAQAPVDAGQHTRELDEGSPPEGPADGEGSAPDQSGS
ncbi:MAG: hypothetical protein M3404_04890, partial [Actinomycetota bacterium]|nr:hypothetical protein [Actinomycetota bacterium]